jgi:hypothetical protein
VQYLGDIPDKALFRVFEFVRVFGLLLAHIALPAVGCSGTSPLVNGKSVISQGIIQG